MNGWAGTILHVDLSRKKILEEPLTRELGKAFLGGRGINAKLLWDNLAPGTDPLGPGNVLVFGAGSLVGTTAPSSGRTTVTCKGPATNLYLKTSMGGHWGPELKFAGYDHLVVHEVSERPVYLWINDGNVELKDASGIWGMDVRVTDKIIREELGDDDVRIACIGPAGENLVKFAAIMTSVYHAAARGGVGAVMGSKKLKAIAVKGRRSFLIKDPEHFSEVALAARDAVAKDSSSRSLYDYGTAGMVGWTNELGGFPAYNFRVGYCENVEPLTGQHLVEKGYLKRRVGCFGCTISCHRYTTVEDGPYKGTYTGGPEYETVSALGAGTGVFETEPVIKANELCNILGLDTISAGAVVQWAMESFERGVLTKEDSDGLDLTFGNSDALVKLIPMIAHRQGRIGNLLAEGVKRAAEKIGKESWKWALCNSKGLEQSRVETRCSKAYALAFAVNPRGPDHLHTATVAECGASPDAVALVKQLTGDEKWASPYFTEFRAEIVRWHEDCYAVTEGLGLCSFTSTVAYGVTPKNMAEMFSAATGIALNEEEIMQTGRRIVTLEKCFNVREGADRKLDDLPWRLMHEPAPTGPGKGMLNSSEELDRMLDQYYSLHGWDQATSRPYRETLEMLGLNEVADELDSLKRLPKKVN
jgi:aldehyde:ferredoxin oxidoreductase